MIFMLTSTYDGGWSEPCGVLRGHSGSMWRELISPIL